jgi:hypothetical protein
VAKKLIYLDYRDSSGAINEIDCTDTLDAAYFTAKLNNTDVAQRWFPTPDLENVENVRADNITESVASGKEIFIEEGQRTFVGQMIRQSNKLKNQIETARCRTELGVFIVDKAGQLIGDASVDGFLRPIKVDRNTWSVTVMPATDTTVQKIQLGFTFSDTVNDGDENIITTNETGSDVNLLALAGLLDVEASAATAITTTGFTIDLSFIYGTACTKNPFVGATDSDFTLFNETTVSAIVIGSVTEGPDGTYVFVIPAQTSADILTLSLSKTGFEMEPQTITIP